MKLVLSPAEVVEIIQDHISTTFVGMAVTEMNLDLGDGECGLADIEGLVVVLSKV